MSEAVKSANEFRRNVRQAKAEARREGKEDLRECAGCKKKMLESMKVSETLPRVLNAEVSFHTPTAPTAEPRVELLKLYGRHVLFDVNSLLAVEVSASAAQYVRERGEAPPQVHGALWCGQQPQWPLMQSPPMKLVLLVSMACNLNCRYCFATANRSKSAHMPRDVALRALDLLRGPINVSFFGGEPLLAWDTVKAVCEEAVKRTPEGKRPRLHVTTNGTLLDADRAATIKRYGMSVLVSLDGPHDVHNAQRPMGTRDSFNATMDGLRQLKAAGVRAFLRATFDDPDTDLAALMAFFAGLADAGLAGGVSIEPAVLSEGCGTGVLTMAGIEQLSKRYHQAAQWYVERARAGTPLDFPPFRKMIERILYTRHAKSECGAGVGYLTVAPDGAIHACHKAGCEIGHLDYGVDEARRAAWADNRVYVQGDCMSCWARYLCGGGCRHHRLALSGDLHGASPAPCAVKKMLITEALWIIAELGPERCKEFIR